MKKSLILTLLLLLVGAFTVQAQSYMVVDTEKIFKSIDEYNKAMEKIDELGKQYQKQIDDAFAEVEQMFNEYQTQKDRLNQNTRTQRESLIIENEGKIKEYQEKVFGTDGELMKNRLELVKPIQERVFKAIENYAKENKFELVLDITANPNVLYYTPAADRTEQLITLLK